MPRTNDSPARRTKAKSPRPKAPESLTLRYDLLSLPTAQHKAGLAGLLLLLDAMRAQNHSPLPTVTHETPWDATITFTRESLQTLMNELYDASLVEVSVKSRWKDKEPLREEEGTEIDPATTKARKVRRFIYEQVQPKGGFFKTAPFGSLADKPHWIKLWRDVIWGTVRGIPTTRNPYNERAAQQDATGSGVGDLWDQLLREQTARSKNRLYTVPVASSILLGAQDHNAEIVPFQGSPAETLLLHFWVAVMLCFVPQVLDKDGDVTTGDGFIIAIPEVSSLAEFKTDFRDALASLTPDAAGYRPAGAMVCLPQEGALQFLSLLLARVKSRVERSTLQYSVASIEVVHLHKPGNTVMTLASDRITVDHRIVSDFERIHRNTHPLLRANLIRNLLAGAPWYRGFHRLASSLDADWLVACTGAKWSTGLFCRDVRKQFDIVLDKLSAGEDA